jgi:hypothetical protein
MWRRLVWGMALALAAVAIVWQIAKRAIDVEQYRPQVEAAIVEFTGLPVTIGALELAWHPVPCLSAHDVSIGEGDFHAATTRLDVFPRIAGLLRLRLEIARIHLVEPAITLPETREQLRSRWLGLMDHVDVAQGKRALAADPGARPTTIRIDELLAEGARLHIGEEDTRPITGSITATGIGSDRIELSVDVEIAHTGARAEGRLSVPAHEGEEMEGDLALTGVRPSEFGPVPKLADAEWEARAELSGKVGGELAVAVDGTFEPLATGALGGSISGLARIAPDGKTRADLEVHGDGLEVRGTARLFAGDRSRARIRSARVEGAALAVLLAEIARDPLALRGAKGAAIEVRDLGVSIASAPRFTSGSLAVHGVEMRWREAAVAPELRLEARAADGVIQIAELRGGPIDLHGTISPDSAARRVAVDLTGTVGLDEALLHAFGAPPAIRAASGAIAIEQLHAELPAPAGESVHYAMRARTVGASVRIESDAYAETVSGVDVQVEADEASLRCTASAVGAALGPITANAEHDFAMGSTRGTIALASPSASFLGDARAQERYSPLLRTYSGAPIAFELQRDADPPHVQRIRFERTAAPRVTAVLVLRPEPAEDRLRDLDVAADVPDKALAGFLPPQAQTSGTATLRVRRSGGGAGFFAEADLGGLGIADGPFLDKKVGEPVKLRIEGVAGAHWQARKLILAAEQGSIRAAIDGNRVFAPDLDVDLAAFSFLLVDGAHATGHLRGSFDTATKSAELQLVGVALSLTPEFTLDAANGTIAIKGDDWALRDLRVHGAESDATLDIADQGDHLRGRVVGARMDADFVRAFFRQIDALKPPDRDPSKTTGTLAIAVDRVHYHRAIAERFAATVVFDREDLHVRNAAFAVGDGRIKGRADVRKKPEPTWIDLDLEFESLPRRFIDDLFEEPGPEEGRGRAGTWVGRLRFSAPLRDELKAMLPDASGSLTATGRDGVLIGRLGLTTRIVTVLRSTEALRMKFPTLHDEGIVYDTVNGDLVMDRGRLEVRSIELDSTSYAMSATGELNFREGTSRVPIEVNAIRGITSLVERVPIAGDALKIVNVRLVATGSPYDMQVQIAGIQDQLIGAGLAGPRSVINRARDVMNLMRRGEATPEPAPDAQPEIPIAPAPESVPPPAQPK